MIVHPLPEGEALGLVDHEVHEEREGGKKVSSRYRRDGLSSILVAMGRIVEITFVVFALFVVTSFGRVARWVPACAGMTCWGGLRERPCL